MKPKIFRDYRFPIGLIGIIGIGSPYAFCLYMMWHIIDALRRGSIDLVTFIITVAIYVFFGVWIVWFFRYLGSRTLSWLKVTEDEIVWRSPFHFALKMRLNDCVYIGVDDMDDDNKVIPIVRGDEVSYIYFSSEPFPNKYKHKINRLKCKKNFIKFAYSDKLCEHLIKVFPQDKINKLTGFYNLMQAQDRINKNKKSH